MVAIKQITERTAIREDEQLAFAREMKVLTKVQHENLVRLYGVCGSVRMYSSAPCLISPHPSFSPSFGLVFTPSLCGAKRNATGMDSPLRIVTEFCEGGACFELLHNAEDVDLIFPQQIKMCNSTYERNWQTCSIFG